MNGNEDAVVVAEDKRTIVLIGHRCMFVQTIQVIEESNAIKTSSANVQLQPIRETI